MTDTAAPLDTPQPAHPVPVLPAPPVVPATVVAPTDEVPWDGRPPVRTERWWTLSILVSLILLVVLMLVWVTRDHRSVRGPDQLTTPVEVDQFLKEKAIIRGGVGTLALIPTGVFVQTLEITSATDVRVTGYVWQKIEGDARTELKTPGASVQATTGDGQRILVKPGFVFPDQIDSSFKIEPRYVEFIPAGTSDVPPPAPTPTTTVPPITDAPSTTSVGNPPLSGTVPPLTLRRTTRAGSSAGTTVVGWYFEAPVREQFDYAEYPFDHKVVKLRIWPADFLANVVLVPDFGAYPCRTQPSQNCTGMNDIFGIDDSIVLGDFSRGDTYFDYFLTDYNSNFGLNTFQESRYPELQFNVLIQRNVANAMVGTLVPLSVAAGLAFAVLLTITASRNRARRFGFSTSQVMATLAALFFAVLIAHQQLRNQFKDIVYFDSFYFLIYLVILGVAINAILVASPVTGRRTFFSFGDNLIPQLLYWPTLLLAADILAITLLLH